MKIVFVSNYYNHHQSSLCAAFDRLTNHNFVFVATGKMREERKKLGYNKIKIPEYVVESFLDSETEKKCKDYIEEADAVIIGSAPNDFVKERIKTGKLVFRYSERPLKKGFGVTRYLPRLIKWNLNNPPQKPIYMLCASAFTAADYSKFGLFRDKYYKWGYFPEFIKYDSIENLIKQKEPNSIIWVGRFIDWKHPECTIELAKKLKNGGYKFSLKIIGTGEIEKKLQEMIDVNNLNDCVYMLGSMKSEQVRKEMEKCQIHIFTSDKQEGWGAVLNEAMNSGCAVVASHEIGSVPFLIENNENGLVYESKNVDMLYEKVKYLLDNQEEQERLGKNAYKTIREEWNSEVAAERLVNLTECILAGKNNSDLFKKGPCSKAEIISDRWKEM